MRSLAMTHPQLVHERSRIRRQVSHVNCAGRFARQDHGQGSRKVSREAPEHANLIGSSGAAAAERNRQIAAWRVLDARPHDFNPDQTSARCLGDLSGRGRLVAQ